MNFEQKDLQTAIQFDVQPGTRVSLKLDNKEYNVEVLGVSILNCIIRSTHTLHFKTNQLIELRWDDESDYIGSCRVNFDNIAQSACEYEIWFKQPLGPNTLQKLFKKITTPKGDFPNRQRLTEAQKQLAMKDIALLQSAVCSLKERQFQILMTGIPIITGLLGTAAGFIFPKGIVDPSQWWVILLPFFCVLLSFSMLAIFMQKNASIRRQDVFTLLLQRYLYHGSFPPCYRGWTEAYANYNHFLRYGGKDHYYGISGLTTYFSIKKIAPADAFSLLAVVFFSVAPFIAFILMISLLILSKVDMFSYTISILATATIIILAYARLWKEYGAVSKGERSFRHLTIIFDEILHYAKEWDPRSTKKLN